MKKVYLETFGCQMNVSDSERVATKLETEGFEIISNPDTADVVLLNTCSIREKAEHKLYTRIGQIRNIGGEKPIIGILGCVASSKAKLFLSAQTALILCLARKPSGASERQSKRF
jgi:tRNA-2-methylthio-N6-dimethylallyladenosine synthase